MNASTEPQTVELDTLVAGENQVVADLAHAAAQPHAVRLRDAEERDRRILVTHHCDHVVAADIDADQLNDHPVDRRGTIKVDSPGGLVHYALRHLDEDATTVWGSVDDGRIEVVFNDHANHDGDNQPGWADHRAVLQLRRSPEWQAWTGIDGRMMSQVELAEFLEDHALEVYEPDGSTLLEVTQTFHATTGATFKSAVKLATGEQQLRYEEEVNASAGRTPGQVDIPTDLVLGLRPWIGVSAVHVPAKFRFQVRRGELALGIRLQRAEEISRDAVERALSTVATELSLEPIEGTAPTARR